MKIKKIILDNFRQFYGNQEVVFSTDTDKNVTLIHAENGTGKTAFLNAILWCFYEKLTSNFKEPDRLLNKVAQQEGKKNYSVTIEFVTDDNKEYLVKRSFGINGKTFQIYDNSAQKSYIKNPNSFINSVIPKDMAKYFFFQGEGVGKISDAKGNSIVKSAVQEILGFTLAKNALNDIKKIKAEYRRAFGNADKTGAIKRLNDTLLDLESKLEDTTERKNLSDKSIEHYKEELNTVDTLINNSNNSVVKELHHHRISSESSLKRNEKLLQTYEEEKVNLIKEYATAVFGFGLSTIALDFIDEQEYKGSIPSPYNEQLVKDILETSLCICDRPIEPGTSQFSKIQSLLEDASDPMLESRVNKARSQLSFIQTSANRAKQKFNSNFKNISNTEQEIKRLSSEIKETSTKLIGTKGLDEIHKVELERKRLKTQYEAELRQNERLVINLKEYSTQLEKYQNELQGLDSYTGELAKYRKLLDFTAHIEKILTDKLETAEKDVEERVILKVNKYLELFVRQDYIAKLNNRTFDIRLVDRNGETVPESEGQSLLLSLTFISSLIELSRERKNAQGQILTPGAIAPFVIDAPFGDLDTKYKQNIASAIPNAVEQVVLLLSSSHWQGSVDQSIKHKIGAEYNMVLEVSSESSGKQADSISIESNTYDTVRYNSPLERTVIEKVVRNA